MSEFSQALEKYIYQSGLTEKQLAKISGFTRSYIALMKNGQRVSPDTVKLNKLLEALGLSPYEYEQIWNAYLKARFGEHSYILQKNVVSFIESFGRISQISIPSDFHYHIPAIRTINNRIDLEIFLKAVVEEEARKPDGYIHMVVQKDFSFLLNLLPPLYRSGNAIKIEHILCLEGAGEPQSGPGYNLQSLGAIMPALLAGYDNGYEVYYYYEKISSHVSSSTFMPYMLMTSKYIINISTDYEYAVISTEAETHQLFEQLFSQKKKSCKRMLQGVTTGANLFEYYARSRSSSEVIFTIGSQPCFGVFPVDAMVKKYLASKEASYLNTMLTFFEENRSIYEGLQGLVSYFTKDGIDTLMEQGLLTELPREMYISLQPKDRLELLKMLIQGIKSGRYKAYLLDENKFLYPSELIISAYSLTAANIIYMSQARNARFALEEQSITRILYSFLEELKMSTLVYSPEDTLDYLEGVYDKYKFSL